MRVLSEKRRTFAGTFMLSALPGGIFGEQHGHGKVEVLALHGWGRSAKDFDRVFARPQFEHRTAVAVDLPGFGTTPLPDFAFSTRDYADALTALLESFAAPVIIVGHSRGGAIAACLAARRPDLVKGLVLTGAPLLHGAGQKKSPARYRLLRRLAKWHLLSQQRLERARNRYGSTDYKNASGLLREILVKVVNESFEEELRSISCPVELVWGEVDTAVSVAVAQRATALLKNAKLTVLSGIDHQTPRHAPEALAEAVERLS